MAPNSQIYEPLKSWRGQRSESGHNETQEFIPTLMEVNSLQDSLLFENIFMICLADT